MLDPYVRQWINKPLDVMGGFLAARGVSAGAMTIFGFLAGLVAMTLIGTEHYPPAAAFMCLNRLCDGLDGAIARHKSPTDFGGFLDIVCDFIVYGGIVFAFGIARPQNLVYALFLIFSFIGPMVSFLAYAILAAKNNVTTNARGVKSFYYLGGICEGTETAFTLILMTIAPDYFAYACVIYGGLCWMTTAGRIYAAYHDFSGDFRRF